MPHTANFFLIFTCSLETELLLSVSAGNNLWWQIGNSNKQQCYQIHWLYSVNNTLWAAINAMYFLHWQDHCIRITWSNLTTCSCLFIWAAAKQKDTKRLNGIFTSYNWCEYHWQKTAKIDCKVKYREKVHSVFLLQIATSSHSDASTARCIV